MLRIRAAALAALVVTAFVIAPARAVDEIRAHVEPGALDAGPPRDLLVRFAGDVPTLDAPGLDVRYRFESVAAVLVNATADAARALAARPDVVFVERDKPIEFLLDTATIASRSKDVTDPSFDPPNETNPPILDANDRPIDGRGVGIAVVDTGLDAMHPDFEGRVGGNYVATPAGLVPAGPYSSTPNQAHGTHVAGIAVGTGASSGGALRGVAPGATLYAFNAAGGAVSLAAIAFDWILRNPQNPPIRVVNNSWRCSLRGCGHPANPGQLHMTLASRLAESGIVVTWAAGNMRGDGDIATTIPESTLRTPGIIGVANYKDEDTGTRDGCLSSSSAWGSSSDPETWPDVAAPGRSIRSAWAAGAEAGETGAGGRNPVTNQNAYKVLTGTSMAAPHVAGIVALMLQARPDLTPADVEYLLKETATPLTGPPGPGQDGCGISAVKADPAHPWHAANYAAGHGLVHAYHAVRRAQTHAVIPPMQAPEPIPNAFLVSRPGLDPQRTFYLTGDSSMSETYPSAPVPRVRPMTRDGVIEHTTAPLSAPVAFDALGVDMFLGSTAEGGDFFSFVGYALFLSDVFRVQPDGTATMLASLSTRNTSARTLGPIHRDHRAYFDTPVHLDAGDRLRVKIYVLSLPYLGVEPGVNSLWDLYTESFTSSRLMIGDTIALPDPDSRPGCERRNDCAMVDETHPYRGLMCDVDVPFRLKWEGPVGSALIFYCDGIPYTCEVLATDPGRETGSCQRDIVASPPTRDPGAFCTYRMPDGAPAGNGRCWALQPIEGY